MSKTESEKKGCSTCEHYNKEYSVCRYNPPTHAGFPTVKDSDYCGKYKVVLEMPATLSEWVKKYGDEYIPKPIIPPLFGKF